MIKLRKFRKRKLKEIKQSICHFSWYNILRNAFEICGWLILFLLLLLSLECLRPYVDIRDVPDRYKKIISFKEFKQRLLNNSYQQTGCEDFTQLFQKHKFVATLKRLSYSPNDHRALFLSSPPIRCKNSIFIY